MKQWLLITLAAIPTFLSANEYEAQLKELAFSKIEPLTTQPDVIDAIKAQNVKNASLSENQIIELDNTWRAEVSASNPTLINQVLNNPLSMKLKETQEMSEGMFTEIFIMDNKGLNVGQSSMTSDYWQGDEAKWQQTYLKGPKSIHISEVEEDESTQTFQSQVSMSITDPSSGQVIGAITVGVNIEEL
ncbi:hypothetical protein VA7868_00184 [Vibrio aerogenes CECT 7868]|uniref:Uncharacterized protein n=2 Tax=Vibrio aerogenes TaxID=92172 RepID=A0A1M5UV60_9VIBR|nr:hypothetical protein [Vibrio aerogenes]SHH66846.1 hypothetical protein VA7868_00184 [Vibrio aerogenes CECT 7868]